MSKNKEPIVLSKEKIRSMYVTLDTIHTSLDITDFNTADASDDNKGDQLYVTAYRVANVTMNVRGLKHDYAAEQFIYRITGMCCDVYDSILARACACLTMHACCHAWTERKQNIIILPDSDLLPANLYWITVFELVYKLKYPQSTDTNKCLVYALNCMLKAGMMTIDDCITADKAKSTRYLPLHTYSLDNICTYLRGNQLRLPKSVYRYYKIFGKRLKRKYKKDQMPDGRVFHLPKPISTYAVADAYTDVICKCIKLNPPIDAKDITKYTTKRCNKEAYFADIRQMKNNTDLPYAFAYLYTHGEPAQNCNIYSNPWAFVRNSILRVDGVAMGVTKYIYLTSKYDIENTAVENCIRLLFVLFHECAHVYHWRAKGRHNSISTREAHATKKSGATYEHHAHKFALWHLIMNYIPIDTINSTFSSLYGTLGTTRTEYTVNYSHCVIRRYCRWLAYLYTKYGKLCIPPDLGYIFVNHETGKLYKPNAEIKSISKTSE